MGVSPAPLWLAVAAGLIALAVACGGDGGPPEMSFVRIERLAEDEMQDAVRLLESYFRDLDCEGEADDDVGFLSCSLDSLGFECRLEMGSLDEEPGPSDAVVCGEDVVTELAGRNLFCRVIEQVPSRYYFMQCLGSNTDAFCRIMSGFPGELYTPEPTPEVARGYTLICHKEVPDLFRTPPSAESP